MSQKHWRDANPEKYKAGIERGRKRVKALYDTKDGYAKLKLAQLKARAKKTGIAFDLDASDIVVPDVCPILGVPLSPWGNTGSTPSVDRVNNALGYVKGNVAVISHKANGCKKDMTVHQVRNLLAYMELHEILA